MTDRDRWPLHVHVKAALEPTIADEDFVISNLPQNIGSIVEVGSLPSIRNPTAWFVKRHLQPGHDCIYAWDGDPCACPRFNVELIPRYDTDWATTGPLIEKYKLYLYYDYDAGRWLAQPPIHTSKLHPDKPTHFDGETPLVAVCKLIAAYGVEDL